MAIKRVRSKESKQGLKWFYDLIKKSAKDFTFGAFNPRREPFIGRRLYVSLRC